MEKGLNSSLLCSLLDDKSIKVICKDQVTSTNSLLKEMGEKGERNVLMLAESQTSGRGRTGNSFYSPSKSGLYLSYLFKPDLPSDENQLLTTAAAVAASFALEELSGKPIDIKWVNDLYLCGRKIAGILCESSVDPSSCEALYTVAGIGINLTDPTEPFPEEIRNKASSLFGKECTERYIREKTAAAFINHFRRLIGVGSASLFIFEEYRKRLFITGKTIRVIHGQERYKAEVLSLNRDYTLKIRKENGDVLSLDSGEVSIAQEHCPEN